MIRVIQIISDNARLPLNNIKGTEKQRFKQAEKLAKNVFDQINNPASSVTTRGALKNAIEKCLSPYKIDFNIVKKTSTDYLGCVERLFKTIHCVTSDDIAKINQSDLPLFLAEAPFLLINKNGYKFHLGLDKNGKTDKYVALHEIRHFFDYLCNPKMMVSPGHNCIFAPEDQFDTILQVRDLYFDFSKHLDLGKIKSETLKKLRTIPNQMQIYLFQDIRYELKTEINAHKQEMKERCKNPANEFSYIIKSCIFLLKEARFRRKLNFVNRQLENCIRKERLDKNRTN